VTLFSYYTL